ncbi:MAG: hypothetical protein U0796_00245 [Gemmatales bacterium]
MLSVVKPARSTGGGAAGATEQRTTAAADFHRGTPQGGDLAVAGEPVLPTVRSGVEAVRS